MSRITQEIKTETKDNIIKSATLLFQKTDLIKRKTKAIAQACNIAEGTLFNYFPTKDDLLIAVFENMAKSVDVFDINQLPNVLEQLIYFSLEPIKQMHKIPKSLLLDLLISSIKMAKKKPKLFYKLAELDIKYIDKLKDKLDIYGDFSNKEIASKDLAEMIYSIVATDFMLYLYQNEENYEDYVNKVKPKLKALIKPYLKEVIR